MWQLTLGMVGVLIITLQQVHQGIFQLRFDKIISLFGPPWQLRFFWAHRIMCDFKKFYILIFYVLGRIACIAWMRLIATGVLTFRGMSVCLCVCLSVTIVSVNPAKRLNRSSCHLGGQTKNMYRWWTKWLNHSSFSTTKAGVQDVWVPNLVNRDI